MNLSLFDQENMVEQWQEKIASSAVILHGFAAAEGEYLLEDINKVQEISPFRHLYTPNGFRMSVAMTNCGSFGWLSDKKGYRYDAIDPLTGQKWPVMPDSFLTLAKHAAQQAGFSNFNPDACLINRYETGSKLSLHQDKDEKDFKEPIVSVSLGTPAIFLFGGLKRIDKIQKFNLIHGDVVVWGGQSRLCYHGIMPLKEGYHPLVGGIRLNLTFRKVS